MGDPLADLKKSIKAKNLALAKLRLMQITSLPEPENREVIQILALAPDKPAFELLSFLTAAKNKDLEIYRPVQLANRYIMTKLFHV
jgi:hypothetical protein